MYVLIVSIDIDIEDGLIVVYWRCATSAFYSSKREFITSSLHLNEQVSGWEAKWCSHRCRRFLLFEIKGGH